VKKLRYPSRFAREHPTDNSGSAPDNPDFVFFAVESSSQLTYPEFNATNRRYDCEQVARRPAMITYCFQNVPKYCKTENLHWRFRTDEVK
jgi:hypothetical protein